MFLLNKKYRQWSKYFESEHGSAKVRFDIKKGAKNLKCISFNI